MRSRKEPAMATASRRITDEVTSWPGVEAGPGRRGEFAFRVGRREIGHLHGDRAAHFSFPKGVWRELFEAGRITHHPVFPDRSGPGARAIEDEDDVREVIALMRLNYERAVGRSPVDGLVATRPEPLPFAPSHHIRAFLLRREPGNILVYSVPKLESDAAQIGAGGGISRWYLNHWHEAMFASEWVSAPLFVHEGEREQVAKRAGAVRGTFSRRHTLDDDFEVIPTPGHTGGATAYLWDTGKHRLLFTGDTIYLRDGEWVAAVLDSSDRDAYLDSLELIRELDFVVLVPWAASAGDPYYAVTDAADARRRIDAIVDRLRRGESS
jgi:glyoxylase-like metal-dependent hydrolase (beta-lactamase superfamily II)